MKPDRRTADLRNMANRRMASARNMATNRSVLNARDINCPYVNDCSRISRAGFLRTAGLGAAALGASFAGLGGVARAQVPPTPIWDPNTNPVIYDKSDTSTLGNWYYTDQSGVHYNYGDCAFVLCAMNTENYRVENEVYYNDHRYDVYGGQIFDCGFNYNVYRCGGAGEICGCDSTCLTNAVQHPMPYTDVRRAACAFGNGTITIKGLPAGSYYLSLYVLDYDSTGRNEKIKVTYYVDESTYYETETENITSFSCGRYIRFLVLGGAELRIKLTNYSSINAVISGLFLDPAVEQAGVTPIRKDDDDSTMGSWNGVYGTYGYVLFSMDVQNKKTNYPATTGDIVSLPSPVTYGMGGFGGNWAFTDDLNECVLQSGALKDKCFAWSWYLANWNWPGDPVGALKIPIWPQFPGDPNSNDVHYPLPQPAYLTTGTWASCDDSDAQVPLYVDLTLPPSPCGSDCYRVAFYATDFDNNNRWQTIEIFSADGAPLSSVDVGPVGPGTYSIFKMKAGSYIVRINAYTGANSILSGIFVDCIPCPIRCTKTIGYWKNHSWNGRTVTICNQVINETLGKQILRSAQGTSLSMLYAQLIAAMLNAGPYSVPEITSALNWLQQIGCPGWTTIFTKGTPTWNWKATAVSLWSALDSFNNRYDYEDGSGVCPK